MVEEIEEDTGGAGGSSQKGQWGREEMGLYLGKREAGLSLGRTRWMKTYFLTMGHGKQIDFLEDFWTLM